MWVFREHGLDANNKMLWAVGYYEPGTNIWFNESCCATRYEAAKRVRWLNGGNEQISGDRAGAT